jgi:hypothetical protein
MAETRTQVAAAVSDITLMPGLALSRPPRPPVPFSASSRLRVEVRPPSLRHAPSSAWERLMFWLLAPAPLDAAPPLDRLPAVRGEFAACLQDLPADAVAALAARIRQARSLRDLWHLRAEIYRAVGVHRSQAEAEIRLTQLNRHFPTRSPRGALEPA